MGINLLDCLVFALLQVQSLPYNTQNTKKEKKRKKARVGRGRGGCGCARRGEGKREGKREGREGIPFFSVRSSSITRSEGEQET
jgi:hypothetical protein